MFRHLVGQESPKTPDESPTVRTSSTAIREPPARRRRRTDSGAAEEGEGGGEIEGLEEGEGP